VPTLTEANPGEVTVDWAAVVGTIVADRTNVASRPRCFDRPLLLTYTSGSSCAHGAQWVRGFVG